MGQCNPKLEIETLNGKSKIHQPINGNILNFPDMALFDSGNSMNHGIGKLIFPVNAKVFTILDAMKGYHQCPLDQESQLLTTFITPYGTFKYLRAPYGVSSISEHYDRRMDEAFAGLQGFRRVVDIIFDSDTTQHASHVRAFLQR